MGVRESDTTASKTLRDYLLEVGIKGRYFINDSEGFHAKEVHETYQIVNLVEPENRNFITLASSDYIIMIRYGGDIDSRLVALHSCYGHKVATPAQVREFKVKEKGKLIKVVEKARSEVIAMARAKGVRLDIGDTTDRITE